MKFTPVIIIGAGRSGTNMLRDIITSIPDFETWDCDEINPIWRYGNRSFETDVLLPSMANAKVKKYIRGRFQKLHNKSKAKYIIEKTCANSLRLAFVYAVFPEAKFIIINRDGRDVVPSAMKRWTSKFELNYTLKKMRYVPIRDFIYYVWKFGRNRIVRVFSKSKSLSFWGPIYHGINKDVETLPLLEVCAKQWQNCAENTIKDRELIPEKNIIDVRYEEFVNNPETELNRIMSFFQQNLSEDIINQLVKKVTNKSVSTHKKVFDASEIKKLNNILEPTLTKLNYY